MKFPMNLSFLFVCLILCSVGMYSALRTKGKSGPFETRLISCHKCDKTKLPFHKEVKNAIVELYNTSTKTNLVRSNATLTHCYRDLMAKVKHYKWTNGKWKLNVVHNSDRCNGFLGILLNAIQLKYDTTHCSLPPGRYGFKDLDANTLQHAVASTAEYGKELWKLEVFTKTGTLFCYEFVTLVVPA